MQKISAVEGIFWSRLIQVHTMDERFRRNEMAAMLGVNRMTLRRAVEELMYEGF